MNKNRNLMYILAVSILASVLIIGINFDKIRFSLSMYNIYKNSKVVADIDSTIKKETAKNPLLKIIEDEIPVDNSVDISVDTAKNETSDKIVEVDLIEEIEPPMITEKSPTIENVENQQETRSIQSITKEYNDKLTKLQIEFENELNSLVQSAINEYKAGISNSKLANIYIEKGAQLEKYSDEEFYSLLVDMELELKDNFHTTDLIDELKIYYETYKSEKKAQLMSEGLELVSN